MIARTSWQRRRRVLLAGLGAALLLLVTFVGPWPTYGRVDLESTSYFQQAFADLAASAARSERTARPGRLRAGWAERAVALRPGTPLAGYGERRGRPSTGVHDDLWVKALVLSDGTDAAAVVASDLLIVPENVAGAVRAAVAGRVPLQADDFSGELSGELEAWASTLGYDLWVLSFNGDYVGYVSPDRYYETASRQGREGYEMYVMSWCGPQQGEFLVRLIRRTVEVLAPG